MVPTSKQTRRIPPEQIQDAARHCLQFIPVPADYESWKDIILHCRDCGLPIEETDAWSQQGGSNYIPGEVEQRYGGAHDPDKAIGALFNLASDNPAYKPFNPNTPTLKPATQSDPKEQAVQFLKDLFITSDLPISGDVTVQVAPDELDEKRKSRPNPGKFQTVAVQDLIDQIQRGANPLPSFIRINPTKGRTKKDVTAYEYALLEVDPDNFDGLTKDQQDAILTKQLEDFLTSGLPIVTLTYSGAKSIHAIVRVDADNLGQYEERVRYLHEWCKGHGINVDPSTKNPDRFTRLPGSQRKDTDNRVELKYEATHLISYEEWYQSLNSPEGLEGTTAPAGAASGTIWRGGKSGNAFLHNKMADYLISNEHFRFLNGTPSIWDNESRHYLTGWRDVERQIACLDSTLQSRQRNEVIKDLDIENNERSPHYYQLDNAHLIGFTNGVLDLTTGELVENSPELNVPITIPHRYHPEAQSPTLDHVIEEWADNDQDVIQGLLEITALAMYRGDEVQQAAVLIGEGSNGKSKFLDLVRATVGPSNCSALGMDDIGARFSTAELENKLVNLGDELSPNALKNDPSVFKSAVSHGEIKVEEKGQKPRKIRPFCSFIFAANSMPYLNDYTGGMIRRFAIIPFTHRYQPGTTPPRDLYSEAAIERLIARALETLPALLERGEITTNKAGRALKKDLRLEGSTVAQWIADFQETPSFNKLAKADLYKDYEAWCGEENQAPCSRNKFTREMNRLLDLKETVGTPANDPEGSQRSEKLFIHTPNTKSRLEALRGDAR